MNFGKRRVLYLSAVYGDNGAIIGVELLNFGL